MKVIIQKVAAYITCENQLLVFTHVDYPQAGIQVPAGTVAEEESLDDAVLREAFEETGLPNLQINLQNLQNSYPRSKLMGYFGILPLRVRFCSSVEPTWQATGYST